MICANMQKLLATMLLFAVVLVVLSKTGAQMRTKDKQDILDFHNKFRASVQASSMRIMASHKHLLVI